MPFDIASLNRKGGPQPPPRLLVYGVAGIGKSTLAAGAPDPVFLWIEDGRGRLDVPGWPESGAMTSYAQVMEAIGLLYSEEHDRKTVVIDSADWLERLVQAETCARNGWKNIEDAGYGKGWIAADDVWAEVISGLDALRDERGMAAIIIAHTEVKKYENPETDSYDRQQIKLHKRASARLQEWSDAIAFLNYRVSITKENAKDPNSRKRAIGGGTRVAYFSERPAFVSKNRWSMPDSIDLPATPEAWANPQSIWAAVAQQIPYYSTNGA